MQMIVIQFEVLKTIFPVCATERASKDGWIKTIFPQYFEEPRAFQSNAHQCSKLVWLDNWTSHNITPRLKEVLATKRVILKYFPPCATHLC